MLDVRDADGDESTHTDVSSAPSPPLPSPFGPRFPERRLNNIVAGPALEEARVESSDEVLLNKGEVPIKVSTTRHHGLLPPPLGQQMQGALFT